MVHHSLPSVTIVLRDPRSAPALLGAAYVIAYVLYVVLGFSALMLLSDEKWKTCPSANSHGCQIQDLYNLNFASYRLRVVAVFLNLYPALNISVYPVVSITLRNNLRKLFGMPPFEETPVFSPGNLATTLLATGPPIVVALFTDKVQAVVTVTGCYAGAAIMLVLPALLVTGLRRKTEAEAEALPTVTSTEMAPIGKAPAAPRGAIRAWLPTGGARAVLGFAAVL